MEVETKNLTAAEEVQLIALLQKCGVETVEAGVAAPTSVVAVAKTVKVKKTVMEKMVVKEVEAASAAPEKKRGRPPKPGGALSAAERARRYREKQKSTRS